MGARKLFIFLLSVSIILIPGLLRTGPATSGSVQAAFHFIKIVEVFPGTTVEPNAQYIEMKMYFAGQNFVGTHEIFLYDSVGTQIAAFVFPVTLPNGANQASILIATPEAESFFTITADLSMTSTFSLSGGKICFEDPNIDCISWGNYSGNPLGTGTPFSSGFGFVLGHAVQRDLGGDGILNSADDTHDSEADFDFGDPSPRNNAGGTGIMPSSTCGNGQIEGLEQCDDGNTESGDGCDQVCDIEPTCGNGTLEFGEECDDGNSDPFDGCDANCVVEVPVCGNGIVEFGEDCDDGNTTPGDGCDEICQNEPVCGNGMLEDGEDCDDGNTTPGDGCDELCQTEVICLVTMTGDVNLSTTLTSADIISLVGYVFKGGDTPLPCEASGDVNCSGSVTSADIIYLVGHVFKGQIGPCDVCSLVPGTWSCS